MIRSHLRLLTGFLAAGALAGSAQAHVVFKDAQAQGGAYYASAIRVSHGCDGRPTTALRVEIPVGVDNAKPQPKPGWTIELEREPLARPIRAENGQSQNERVKVITWRGRLDADYFDEFGLSAKLPTQVGPIYFPVVQTCDGGETRWTDIPAAGAAWGSVPHPAPVVTLIPALEIAPAHHH